ncbi:2931_t:CDS:10 [Ambispora gerdemannii]|uniref:2931_t:CDS:1 n=1 Tax=Ambispora gerdemannii TaxID=144530 RepID=A0A9N8YN20_9GLOM|nr:2931_t:CDS:10 [Ambispora gerdemannii]
MKFAKVLQAELVPEWRIEYIDYKHLKKLLKRVEKAHEYEKTAKISRKPVLSYENRTLRSEGPIQAPGELNYRTWSMSSIPGMKPLIERVSTRFRASFSSPPVHYRNDIHRSVTLDNLMDHVNDDERVFFEKLDEELETITKFYKREEAKAAKNFEILKAQYKKMRELRKKQRSQDGRSVPIALVKRSIDGLSMSVRTNKIQSENAMASSPAKLIEQEKSLVDFDYRDARKKIKKAVFEFYRGTELLKNFKVLNKYGFVKILKKFDKLAGWKGGYIYMQKVNDSYFVTSKELDRIIKETENFYADKFEGGRRSEAMDKLRLPDKLHQIHHLSVWRAGIYMGISLVLIVQVFGYIFRSKIDDAWDIILRIYGGFLPPILLPLLFGLNLILWTKERINYKFIFEFDLRENLDYQQYFEFRVFFSSFFPVEFRDFFIADCLNSLSYTFFTMGIFGCAYKNEWNDLQGCTADIGKFLLLATLPPFWRLLQCLKRFLDTEKKYPLHLANAGKYMSSILVIIFASLHRSFVEQPSWGVILIISQCINSLYTFSWDVMMDWSLFQPSDNIFLRDELGFSQKSVYYFAIVSNFILRFSWTMNYYYKDHDSLILFLIGFAEMLRRWQWTFFRVESEHIINCDKRRAIKEVTLPFRPEPGELKTVTIPPTGRNSTAHVSTFLSQRIRASRDFEPRHRTMTVPHLDSEAARRLRERELSLRALERCETSSSERSVHQDRLTLNTNQYNSRRFIEDYTRARRRIPR